MGNELSPYQRCLLLEGTLLADAPQRAVSGLSPRAAIGPRGSQASRSSPTHGIFGVLPTAQSRSEPRRHFAEQDINFAVVAARMRRWAVLTVLMKAAPGGGGHEVTSFGDLVSVVFCACRSLRQRQPWIPPMHVPSAFRRHDPQRAAQSSGLIGSSLPTARPTTRAGPANSG